MALAPVSMVDTWHIIAPTVLCFLGGSRQVTTHGWNAIMKDITAPRALELLVEAAHALSDIQEYHQLILEIYLYSFSEHF